MGNEDALFASSRHMDFLEWLPQLIRDQTSLINLRLPYDQLTKIYHILHLLQNLVLF